MGCRISILVTSLKCQKIVDVGDRNGQNRHQHLKVFTKTFRLTSIDVTEDEPAVH